MHLGKLISPAISSLHTVTRSINSVAVIGSGLMGSGIAQVSAQAGLKVHLIDKNEEILKKSTVTIKRNLGLVAKKKFKDDASAQEAFVSNSLANLVTSTDMIKASKDSDLIIEAVIENLEIKHEIFKSLDASLPAPCMLASNTSSLLIKEIAKVVQRKDRIIGLHFFNPVPVMKLVEVVKTDEVSQVTQEKIMAYCKAIGKTPVICRDTPGFIVNRLLIPNLMEAMRLYERGDASFQDIDVAMKLGAGHPMGPFELADYVGLDTALFIIQGWHKNYPNNTSFEPPKILIDLCSQGKYGRKSGEGFYKYDAVGNKVH
ncbi:hypothetical protein Ciccas_012188 [Cichlidogyrus casuarinus]|uniref:3-hydroxyacyl-CoA dehydrogenase n=1 Tax=Cichlidogyrus casuarinus TaxID=1844966 RepID=A0ABD2PRE5_9PLAT